MLVAGGYGVAPFRFLGEELKRAGRPHGSSTADARRATSLSSTGSGGWDSSLVPATEDGSLGERGRVTVPLGGPPRRGRAEAGAPVRLRTRGDDARGGRGSRPGARLAAEVSLDPWMGCGVGTCLACVVRVQGEEEPRWKYRCACTEGPVFDSARVVWPGEEDSRAHRAAPAREEDAP